MSNIFCRLAAIAQLAFLVACATSGSLSKIPVAAPVGILPMEEKALAVYADWPGFKEGVKEAKESALLGNYTFYSYGLEVVSSPRPLYYRRYDEFLMQHGVVIQNQGCELDSSGKLQGRNHTIALEVLARYGSDFWQHADAYARQSESLVHN